MIYALVFNASKNLDFNYTLITNSMPVVTRVGQQILRKQLIISISHQHNFSKHYGITLRIAWVTCQTTTSP